MTFKGVKGPKKFVEDYVGEKLKWGLKNKFGINFIYGIDSENRRVSMHTYEFIDATFEVHIFKDRRELSEDELNEMEILN